MIIHPVNGKPSIIDMESDFHLIQGHYSGDFWGDYHNLHFIHFRNKIFSIKEYKEVLRARKILIGDINEKDKEVRKWARQFMTTEIEEYRKKANEDSEKVKFVGMLNSLSDVVEEKRKQRIKMKKRGING